MTLEMDGDRPEQQYVDGMWTTSALKRTTEQQGWSSQTGFRYQRAGIVTHHLPRGIYRISKSDHGIFFEKQSFPTDEAVDLPGLPIAYILKQMTLFWERADIYRKHGLIHKRGILLYGFPGCGKTSIVRLLCDEIMRRDGIIFSIDDFGLAAAGVGEFRSAEPDRLIMTIQEDIEGYFDGTAGPAQLKAALSFLDGQDQTSNVVHLATTNEPEKLADRFIKRPGRFDLVLGIHNPSAVTRRAYLKHIDANLNPPILDEMVQKTEGLSLAYMRELIATYLCLDIPLDETIARLKTDAKKKVLKNPDDLTGFTVGYRG